MVRSGWKPFLASFLTITLSSLVEAKADDKFVKIGNQTIERTVELRTHSLYAPYIDSDLQNRWWDFGADSYVNTNKHIRLTRAAPSQMGWLWSRLPLTATNILLEVEFKISGDAGHLFGDGLAVWLTKERAQPGPIWGNTDKFDGLGIFLDTYANARHDYNFPRISAMLGDGKTSFDFGNDGDKQTLGSCYANFRRTNVATKLRIVYVRDTFLDVKVQHKAWDEWTDCFRVDGISLPAATYLGFSAMTGDVVDAHDIISVTTSSAVLSKPESQRDKLKGSSSEGSSVFVSFFKILLFVGLCAGGYYGYQQYQRKKRYGGGFGNFPMTNSNMYAPPSPAAFGGGGMYSNTKRF